jgi:Uma2 family endonuclease
MVENPRQWLAEVTSVRLVCEITSTNKAADTVRKKRYYAEAGIPWYLIVEPDEPILTLYRLSGRRYVEEATAKPGQILHLTDPVAADLDPAALAADD